MKKISKNILYVYRMLVQVKVDRVSCWHIMRANMFIFLRPCMLYLVRLLK